VSLLRIINVPTRGIGLQTIDAIRQLAAEQGTSLWEAIEHPSLSNRLTQRAYSAVSQFRELIQQLRALRDTVSVTYLLNEVLKRTDYLQRLGDTRDPEVQSRVENVRELLTATQQFDASPEAERGLAGFLEGVALVADVDSLQGGQRPRHTDDRARCQRTGVPRGVSGGHGGGAFPAHALHQR
jgi:DNA helicase-2/ATP-dependent DNA helicase PcrA